MDYLYNSQKNMLSTQIQSTYQMDFASYLQAVGMTEETFKTDFIKEQIKPMMETQMIIYAIADKEGFEATKEEMENQAKDITKSIGNAEVTVDQVKEYYGDYYFEEMVITEKVTKFLYDNAEIK